MPTDTSNTGISMGRPISRRGLLCATVAVGGLAALSNLAAPLSASAADDGAQSFTQLSEFLTGYTLDPVLSRRYLAALSKRNPTLATDITALDLSIKQSGAANMDAFLALPSMDPALKKTASKIVSAWYLGVVGDPQDAELITYADALMYRPSAGILPIPTYGPGPNAWGPKPDSKI